MPALSQQQQKLFGLALSVKRGDTPRSEASEDVLKIVDSMSEKEIEDFAGTEHKGLPKKVEQKIREMVRKTMKERAISELELSKDDMDKLHSDGEVEVDGEKVTYEKSIEEAKFNRGDMVRVIDKPKYVLDKKTFAGKSGYVKNIMGRDVAVTFPNGRTILVDPKDLEMNPNESVNEQEKTLPELMKIASEFKKELSDLQREYNKTKTKTLLMRVEAKKGQLLRVANAIRAARAKQAESVNEGKKVFKVNPQIGKAKYSISSHDGVKKHKDGSDFFDIEIFKSKVDLEKAIKNYKSKGFVEESVNEADVVGKTVFSDGKGKLVFGYYKDDDGVTLVDYKTWAKLNMKDVSKGDTNKDRVINAILRNQKQFNKKVEYNMWSKKTNPSFEEKMDWFIKNRWISNINKGGIKESINEVDFAHSKGGQIEVGNDYIYTLGKRKRRIKIKDIDPKKGVRYYDFGSREYITIPVSTWNNTRAGHYMTPIKESVNESVNESIKYKDVKKGDVLYTWIYGSKKGGKQEREYYKVKILEPISDEPGHERFRAKQLDGLNKGKTVVVWLDTLSKKANESVNEAASRTAREIGGLTGMNSDFIQKFVDTHNLDIEKVFQFVKKGNLKDRMDFVTGLAGKPNNPYQKKLIKMVGESVNEGMVKIEVDLFKNYNQRRPDKTVPMKIDDKTTLSKLLNHTTFKAMKDKYDYIELHYGDKFLGSAMAGTDNWEFKKGRGLSDTSFRESVDEGASSEELRMAKNAIRNFAKHRRVPNEEAIYDLLRAVKTVEQEYKTKKK